MIFVRKATPSFLTVVAEKENQCKIFAFATYLKWIHRPVLATDQRAKVFCVRSVDEFIRIP